LTTKKVSEPTTRKILVHGDKDFVLEIASDVRMTFGPWSPPSDKNRMDRYGVAAITGTLRFYKGTATTQNIIGLYTNVTSFRDLDVKHLAILSLPICNVCKQNLVVPGEDLCSSCNGHSSEPEKVETVLAF
jgi:hypothetical protein